MLKLIKDNAFLLLLTFAVTAAFDVALQTMQQGGVLSGIPGFLGFETSTWYLSLKEYFARHTPLAAALIAGFIGACAQVFVLLIAPVPRNLTPSNVGWFMAVTAAVSGVFGLAMQATGMFPHLDATYYSVPPCMRDGARVRVCAYTMYADAFSGVWVNSVLLLLVWLGLV